MYVEQLVRRLKAMVLRDGILYQTKDTAPKSVRLQTSQINQLLIKMLSSIDTQQDSVWGCVSSLSRTMFLAILLSPVR